MSRGRGEPFGWGPCDPAIRALSVIDFRIPGRFVPPDDMQTAGRINGNDGLLGPARIPGEPFARCPRSASVRALSVIDFIVSWSVIMPDHMEIVRRINGNGWAIARCRGEPFARCPGR